MSKTGSININSLLQEVSPTISKILLAKYGNVGISIGVMKDGEQSYLDLGQTSIGGSITPDYKTIYLIASMTKPIIALSMFILVSDKSHGINIHTPVSDILDQLKHSQGNTLRHANRELRISDLLNLRSEFHKGTSLWESPNGDIPWQTIDPIMSLLCNMPNNEAFSTEASFTHERNYVNECYALAGAIIEKKTNMPWAKFVREKIFDPLGMSNTFAGITKAERKDKSNKFVASHSAQVEQTLTALRNFTGTTTPSYAQIEQYIVSSSFIAPKPIQVPPSKASRGTDTMESTPLGAAGGIMSTTSDILRFTTQLLKVYHAPKNPSQPQDSELARGMAAMLEYLDTATETGTYAAGWNHVLLPWDPSVPDTKPRWPGADGDNVRRLETAMKERCRYRSLTPAETQQYCQSAWPFFRGNESDVMTQSDLALYHGGSMIGVNSFWFVVPHQRLAVVVLCNTRGFVVDAANLTCMLLVDGLYYRGYSPDGGTASRTFHVQLMCSKVEVAAQRIAASYLWEVTRYEDRLLSEYPYLADGKIYGSCVGRYQFCEGIFATVQVVEGDNSKSGSLEFRLYGGGFGYPLRVSRAHGIEATDEGVVNMTFAVPMGNLIRTGVGGSNRLGVEDFRVVFGGRDGRGRYGWFLWNFARGGLGLERGDGGDGNGFVFRRDEEGAVGLE